MTIRLIIYGLCFVLFGGYALLGVYLTLHGAHVRLRRVKRAGEYRTSVGASARGADRGEDVFVYKRGRDRGPRLVWSSGIKG